MIRQSGSKKARCINEQSNAYSEEDDCIKKLVRPQRLKSYNFSSPPRRRTLQVVFVARYLFLRDRDVFGSLLGSTNICSSFRLRCDLDGRGNNADGRRSKHGRYSSSRPRRGHCCLASSTRNCPCCGREECCVVGCSEPVSAWLMPKRRRGS